MRSVAVLAGVAVALVITSLALARGERQLSASRSNVAIVTTNDFRVVVSAIKTGAGQSPTADVVVASFQRRGSEWGTTKRIVLPGLYFWHTVSGPRAICRIELNTASSRSVPQPRLKIQFLVTPSVGCGRVHDYVVGDS